MMPIFREWLRGRGMGAPDGEVARSAQIDGQEEWA
jgi:hypothetical protein